MNDLSANDIMLFGVLTGALVAVLLGLLWALAHQGRKRWNADHQERDALGASGWESQTRYDTDDLATEDRQTLIDNITY